MPLGAHTFPSHQLSTFGFLLPRAGAPLGVIFSLPFPTANSKTSFFLFFHLNAPHLPSAQLGEHTLPHGIPSIALALCFPGKTLPSSAKHLLMMVSSLSHP